MKERCEGIRRLPDSIKERLLKIYSPKPEIIVIDEKNIFSIEELLKANEALNKKENEK